MKFFGNKSANGVFGRVWDPRTGWRTTARYKGSVDRLESLLTQYRSLGYRCQLDPDEEGGFGVLSVEYANDDSQSPTEPLSDQWTLAGNDLEKSIFELKELQDAFDAAGSTPQQRAQFRADAEAIVRGEKTIDDVVGSATSDPWALWLTAIVQEMARGIESFTVSQFVLRRVITINSFSTIKPALDNVGRVFSTDSLRGSESVPSTLRFDLPAGFWLKRTPTVEQAGIDRWSITQEWWHADSYSALVYGDPL